LVIHEEQLCAISINYDYPVQIDKNRMQKTPEEICIPDDFTPVIDAQPTGHLSSNAFLAINGSNALSD
jgi:hypothetical protein